MEYLKGSCYQASGLLGDFCTKFPLYNDLITWAPRPTPDESALPRLQYLPYDKTPVAGEDGSPRVIDDFQPRIQFRKMVQNGSLSLDDNEAIAAFSKEHVVAEDLIRKYLKHLQYLKIKKLKRINDRKKRKKPSL